MTDEKDYNIHTPEADAERERRIKIMKKDMSRRGMGFSFPVYYCENCKRWLHGPEFLFCDCLINNKQMFEDMEKCT